MILTIFLWLGALAIWSMVLLNHLTLKRSRESIKYLREQSAELQNTTLLAFVVTGDTIRDYAEVIASLQSAIQKDMTAEQNKELANNLITAIIKAAKKMELSRDKLIKKVEDFTDDALPSAENTDGTAN